MKADTLNIAFQQHQTSLLATLKVTFNNIESAPNQNQTQPTTQTKPKTNHKTQTETAQPRRKKIFPHKY